MYSNKGNINILTALLVKFGVQHIVVCPGSRNAPLVHNFSECPDMVCHPVTDERSAGFIAIGLTQQLHTPVAVCVTSGSALLNVLPAAAEATYQHCGIIVISADRPEAWIDQLDGQTCPQPNALGSFVAKSVNLPEVDSSAGNADTQRWHCNRLVNEALLAHLSPARPSVHINVPISEPLFDFTCETLPNERYIKQGSWDDDTIKASVVQALSAAGKPMVVLGQLSQNAYTDQQLQTLSEKVVLLAEPLSTGTQQPSLVDQMIYAIMQKHLDYEPDVVLFIGGHTISKRLRQYMRSLRHAVQITVTPDGSLKDISQHSALVVQGLAATVIRDINSGITTSNGGSFVKKWLTLRERVQKKHDAFKPAYSQMLAAKLFEESMTNGVVYYANSMSVRLAALYASHYCHCNRGLNGIEGSLSVAAGAALAQAYRQQLAEQTVTSHTYCVIGDLSFFYDENALWQQQLSGNFRILLLNNSQGGIFRNLKGLEKSPVRDGFVSARHDTSAEGICRQFNVTYLKATDEPSLREGITQLTTMDSSRPVLLEVITDVNTDEQEFKRYFKSLL